MRYHPTSLAGAYVIELEKISDQRGFFARTWCQNEFADKGLNSNLVQCNVSYNKIRGTLRGMHYQRAPYWEAKLVRCTRGAIYDVIIDLRNDSKTFTHWFGVKLTSKNRKALYVPEGFAHGFLTLKDHTEVIYQMSEAFSAGNSDGVRWNDAAFGIKWPLDPEVISEQDNSYPFLQQE